MMTCNADKHHSNFSENKEPVKPSFCEENGKFSFMRIQANIQDKKKLVRQPQNNEAICRDRDSKRWSIFRNGRRWFLSNCLLLSPAKPMQHTREETLGSEDYLYSAKQLSVPLWVDHSLTA